MNEISNKQKMLSLKIGDFVEFKGNSMKIWGCICRINDDNTIDYVRESLTTWNASSIMIQKGRLITKENFISRVKYNAEISGAKIPSTDEVITALELFKSNIDVDFSEIYKALNL
jgi:hypothetical protein